MVTQDEGITPACAGKSLRLPRLAGLVGNHPRVRGEEWARRASHERELESPPRARGREPGLVFGVCWNGITPACAGKSSPTAKVAITAMESPPRARGRDGLDDGQLVVRGITPACAGKSRPVEERHKRASESPPRARGRVLPGAAIRREFGITPACAGKRPCIFRRRRRSQNHPRVRGEESNENAASEDMVIPPKCKFFALFSRAALKRRVIPNAGPGAFRLSNFCLYSSLCVPA